MKAQGTEPYSGSFCSVGTGWGLKSGISNRFPGYADITEGGPHQTSRPIDLFIRNHSDPISLSHVRAADYWICFLLSFSNAFISVNPHNNPWGNYCQYSHFKEEETEPQRGYISCLIEMAKLSFKAGQDWLKLVYLITLPYCFHGLRIFFSKRTSSTSETWGFANKVPFHSKPPPPQVSLLPAKYSWRKHTFNLH